jgi:hypothetical protein
MKKLFIAWFTITCFCVHAQETKTKMKPLFNGNNLNGWYTYLKSKGKNNDPEKIFSVKNGLLFISGKEFGYMCTEKTFTDFHLVVEFKWGKKKYPPRDADSTKRDNGICYYFSPGEKDTVWPRSIECQIQEGDTGDFWLISGVTIKVNSIRSQPDSFTRIKKRIDAEMPTGEWNRVEVIANDGKITYIVNAKVVNEGEDPNVSQGKILIQSEGAEIYYRKIELAEL